MNEQTTPREDPAGRVMTVAHLTTVDLSLRFLLWPQLMAVVDGGGTALGISSPGPWVSELEEAGVKHVALKSSTRGVSLISDLRAAVEFWREIRGLNLTVLHTHNPKPGIYGRILGRLAGVPVVVNTLHGFYATETDPVLKRVIVYGLEALAARFSDTELHQNIEDLELAKRLRIVRPSRARLLGNGIDLTRFDPSRLDADARRKIRDELGAADSDIVVGTVGRLVAEKGFPELFEAVEQLGSGFVFAVVGPVDPDKPDSIPAEVVERATAAGVRFLGMRNDMEDLYAGMDIFILPSHREGFPRAAMEAAAMALPVVATDIRGCRQVVQHGVNGLLIPVRDPEAISHAIKSLADDPGRRSSMAKASREIALEDFDEKRVVGIVLDTYRDVMTAKGLTHLLPSGLAVHQTEPSLRPARNEDARGIANLHSDVISEGTLPPFSRRFMKVFYRALLRWPGTTAFVTEDGGGLTGFVVAVDDPGAFSRWFIRRSWLPAVFAALPGLLKPANAIAAIKRLRHAGENPEILSLGVAARSRRSGSGGLLLQASLRALESGGSSSVRVVVGSENEPAIRLFEKTGFETEETGLDRARLTSVLFRQIG